PVLPSGTDFRTTTREAFLVAPEHRAPAYIATVAVVVVLASLIVARPAHADSVQAVPDSASTAQDTAVEISVLANDSGSGLFVAAKTNGSHGTTEITGSDETVTYTPDSGFHGVDTFTYTA